jgi:hypothetical protein
MSHSLCVMGVDDEVKITVPVVVRYVHSDSKEKRNIPSVTLLSLTLNKGITA